MRIRWEEISKEKLVWMYETMVKIREFETVVEQNFLRAEIPGFVHSYVGEEAIATGVVANLRKDDYITSTHRGHGHLIAKGADLKKMMAEIYGKRTGYCKGKGGSMHIADISIGVLGANGEVAGGIPIAVGAGLAIKFKGTDQVVVSFFGDGATNRGAFHEGLNFAAVYNLPVVFVVEFNEYASTAPAREMIPVKNVAVRAASYGFPGVTIDGNNVLEVYEAAKIAIERARHGGGPFLIEAKTYRLKGHFIGDPELYRDREEVQRFWKKEPIGRYEKFLLKNEILTSEEMEEIKRKVREMVMGAVEFARNSEFPKPEEALEDLFVDDRGYDY
ncbi:thiamine pyrophosphate-dependent dehydrogenase E1 component subunit alpha [Thermococcus sp. MV5]|uniref:thiamine pyrophosphate-dependent dehydrogenase E1 component subunit alpha n=1 Tax=Thermococcus sp. MV5 TaxID=1638272 RepID=UPI001439D8E3|nr:thiamine pyrophosphate-dependent dehydrogenase E1 component subunit alpha [Thermococcus sp. MV5]NJE26579.1 thiamine pyrophosphate-dependent dehydrogenase E1 component subunit alpha [Thermococcus sp. MV5]